MKDIMIKGNRKDFQAADRYNKFHTAKNAQVKVDSQVTHKNRGFVYKSCIANTRVTNGKTCCVPQPSRILQSFHNATFW